jgi:hypothetical protein
MYHYHPKISLPLAIIESVENEEDFEFLAGMLLLQKVNESSSFCKGLRTSKV